MKKWKLIPLVSLFALFGLVSCGTKSNDDNPDNPPVVVTKYKITYVSEHGTKPADKTDVTSITEADLPTLTDDEYTFGGWFADANYTITVIAGKMTSDMTLYAKWTKKSTPAATYSITYVSEHGTKPSNKTGVTAITEADLPTLTDDNYTFGGWYTNSSLTTRAQAGTLSANVTLYAKWTAKPVATYSITYVSDHGTKPSNKTNVTSITETDLPTLTDDNYTFGGWYTNSLLTTPAQTGALSTNVTLYAKWIAKTVTNTYTITFKNDDGTTISSNVYQEGETVTVPSNPTKASNAQYTYTFAGWDNTVSTTAVANAIYTATYNATIRSYTVTWKMDDNTVIDTTTVNYGVVPTHANPAKDATAQYTYSFTGWDNTPSAVTGNVTYKATFSSTVNSYTITWKMDDDSVIDTTTVNYGAVPTHANPSKAEDTDYTYTFAGWTPSLTAVTGAATYKAAFTPVEKENFDEDAIITNTALQFHNNGSGISNVVVWDNNQKTGTKSGFTVSGTESNLDNPNYLSFKNGITISFKLGIPSGKRAVLKVSYYYDSERTVNINSGSAISGSKSGASSSENYIYSYDLASSGTVQIISNSSQNYLNWIAVEFLDTSVSLTNLDVSYMKAGGNGGKTSYGNATYESINAKTLYMVGESFDSDGIYGVATFSDNTTDVLYGSSLTYTGFDSSTTGKKTVTVSYTHNGTTLSDTFDVYVTNATPKVVNNVLQVKVSGTYSGAPGTVVGDFNAFKTIGQALDFLRTNSSAAINKYMYIDTGTYNEKITIDLPNLTIEGAGADSTIIEFDSLWGRSEKDGFTQITDSTQTMTVMEAASNFTLKNITVSNYWNSYNRFVAEFGTNNCEHRALAMLIYADKVTVDSCKLLGYQDTLEAFTGRSLFIDSYISGATDFIFGTNPTMYFKNCEIRSIYNGSSDGGYINAFKGHNKGSSDAVTYGAIYDGCTFTADSNVTSANTSIARPWTDDNGTYSKVMIMNSTLGAHISKAAYTANTTKNQRYVCWTNKNQVAGEPTTSTVHFYEYNNSGTGAISSSINGATVLTQSQAANYNNLSVIFGTTNGSVTYSSAWDVSIAERITITLELNGGSGTPTSVTINKGSILAVYEPTKSGYVFDGWCYDQACSNQYDDEPLNTATTLYAKWSESTQSDPVILLSSGYTEAIYATFDDSNPESATVKYKATSSDDWIEVDEELIRPLTSTTARVDIVGLEKGKYDIQVITSQSKQEIKQNITVYPDDRSGYAHFDASTPNRMISTGIGAYNNDGTLKSGATVVYVTDETKNTVTAGGYTGLVNILMNAKEFTALDVRIIGTIKTTQWNSKSYSGFSNKSELASLVVASYNGAEASGGKYYAAELLDKNANSYSDDLAAGITTLKDLTSWGSSSDSYWNMCDISDASNLTIEGIGPDAGIYQWGLTISKCNYVEIKNLTFDHYTEDAVGIQGGSNTSMDYHNFWIHNCTFEEGVNRWDVSDDQDKSDGDGSTDFKYAHNLTISYCKYVNTHKTNLIGGNNSALQYNITLHHNYYDTCQQRLPLVRQANVHIYNNYYSGTTSFGTSARAHAFVFTEGNYYTGKNPFMMAYKYDTSKETADTVVGTTIKAIGNHYSSSVSTADNKDNGYGLMQDGIYVLTSSTASAGKYSSDTTATRTTDAPSTSVCNPNGTSYVNFDTNDELFYYDGTNHKSDVQVMNDTSDIPTAIPTYAGAGKCNAIKSEYGDEASTETYDVSYVSAHGTAPSTVTGVKKINSAMLPTLTASGYTFGGWYTNSACTAEATEGMTITQNTTLYAKWTEKSGTETHSFNFNDGNLVDEDGFFTITASGGDASTSTNTGSIVYDGVTYTKTLKIDSKPTVNFTTTAVGQLTIVAGNNVTINIDGTAYTPDSDNVITISNLSSGSHTINKGAGQNYIYLIIVEF